MTAVAGTAPRLAQIADRPGPGHREVRYEEAAGDLDGVRLPSGVRRYFRAQVEALLRRDQLTPEQMRALRDELVSPRTRPSRLDATREITVGRRNPVRGAFLGHAGRRVQCHRPDSGRGHEPGPDRPHSDHLRVSVAIRI